jgi:predicted enzyme related to lactoylglutathione lyase
VIPARISGLFCVNPQVSLARGWYEGLGWKTERSDHVFVPFPLAGTAFSLWSADSAASSVAAVQAVTGTFSGRLLSIVVDDEKEVDAVLDAVTSAGGRVVVEAGERPFGRAGWFVDPVGTTWEVSWIDGHDSGEAFDGRAGEAALATSLGAVTVYVEDPDASFEFYAKNFGWNDVATSWAGHPALAVDGALLAFAPTDALHPAGECGAIMLTAAAEVDTVHASLVAAGAESLSEPTTSGDFRSSAVVDPNGVIWDLVFDPNWTATASGPVSAKAA